MILMLAACQPSPTPSVPPQPSSTTDDEAARAAAAAVLGLPAEQLLATEDGYVGVRFVKSDAVLQLVLAQDDAESWRAVVLAAAAEPQADPLRLVLSSLHAVVCPPDSGLTRTMYLFGQETSGDDLVLVGIPNVGGSVTHGTFAFAMEGSPEQVGRWSITKGGSPRSNGDGRVFTRAAQVGAGQSDVGCSTG